MAKIGTGHISVIFLIISEWRHNLCANRDL